VFYIVEFGVRNSRQRTAAALSVCLGAALAVRAAAPVELAKFTGVASCQSSLCHGGGEGSNQCTIWKTLDFHTRAFAILLTPRSQAITDAMKSVTPTLNDRCTACHSPLRDVPASRVMEAARVDDGVSCENCHGPASEWLRSHTRTDYTYAQRLASGMRDLRSAYGRANTCVGCHEYLSPDIAKAGHPELIFELDSQTVSEPPHWKETDAWMGLHAWLAGQAVAFREDTWHALDGAPGPAARWSALGWLLEQSAAGTPGLPPFAMKDGALTADELASLQKGADKLARAASSYNWTTDDARQLLQKLARTGVGVGATKDADASMHRAEVLVQGLDRLLVALHAHGVPGDAAAKKLDALFTDRRTPDGYDAGKFTRDLATFSDEAAKL
jgi:hypothetical protein